MGFYKNVKDFCDLKLLASYSDDNYYSSADEVLDSEAFTF